MADLYLFLLLILLDFVQQIRQINIVCFGFARFLFDQQFLCAMNERTRVKAHRQMCKNECTKCR